MISKISIALFAVIGSISIVTPTYAKSESPKEALSVCWKTDSGKYYCDGPTQRTASSYESIQEALSFSGCSNALAVQDSQLRHEFLGNKNAVVYKCNYKLKEGSTSRYTANRDVRLWWDGIIY
jgi:hypothetical protein